MGSIFYVELEEVVNQLGGGVLQTGVSGKTIRFERHKMDKGLQEREQICIGKRS